jgi:hypothetical protein
VAYASTAFSAEDLFVRVVLHRLFSWPETWALLDETAGGLTASTRHETIATSPRSIASSG